jgi:hypothetical protein
MTPTTSEREALTLLRDYRMAAKFSHDHAAIKATIALEDRIDAFLEAALTRQEAQQEAPGAVACQKCKGRRYVVDVDIDDYGSSIGTLENCPACNGVVCASTLDDAAGDPVLTVETARSLLRDAAAGIRYLYATPPAPVDVRSILPKATFKNVPRGDSGKYPNGEGWGHAWSAPVVEIERADWDRFITLLDGQPAGVDADPRIALFYEAVELQRTYYGDGAGLHLEMIDWAAKAAALGGGGGRG